jgi:hypothetical protein
MLVTPKKGTACLTLTLVVDATVIVMVSPQNDHCLLQIISRRRSQNCSEASRNQRALRRFRDGERRAACAVTNL